MIPEEDQRIVEEFVHECLAMVGQARPFVRALVERPDREDIVPQATANCFRLFHSIKGSGAFLGLEYLTAPAEAMEYLLDQVRSGVLPLTPRHVSLLAEACQFVEQGARLLLVDNSDQRLAASADSLTTAILQAAHTDEVHSPGAGGGGAITPEARASFVWETEQLLASAEQEFVLWDIIAVDTQRIAELCRLLHRLKQNFALYDFSEPERLCGALESTLNRYLQGEFFQTEYPDRVFVRAIDAIRAALVRYGDADDVVVERLDEHLLAVQGVMRQPIGQLLIEAGLVAPDTVDDAVEVQRSSRGEKPRRLGEVLVEMGKVTAEQVEHILQEQHNKRRQVEQAESALKEAHVAAVPPVAAASAGPHEVSVDGRKLARMGTVLQQLARLMEPAGGHAHLLAELQDLVDACNRQALASLVNRLQRMVHDLAVHRSKRVYFVAEGMELLREETDATVLVDVLLHLLRNSVEHGLETVEERERAGKRKSGKLTVLVLRQGEELWVSVEDDGCGFDMQRIAALSIERGFTSAETIERFTQRELVRFLFQGASHPEGHEPAAANLPGLAVVHRALRELGGKIDISSRPGKGARVTLRLPRKPRGRSAGR